MIIFVFLNLNLKQLYLFLWYYIDIKTQLTGLSNQFEPSIVFDPSEFEGPRFDSMHNVTHNALNKTNISKSIVT
jgi:hypothetical protein